jgi:uncharacterized protein (DUF2336 family)
MTVVSHFLKWVHTAKVGERSAAAAALARAYVNHDLPFEDRCAAEAALTLLLDDPSSNVRLALADALSMSRHAPPQIISALASDQPEIAALVLARSPLFTDADLIDRIVAGSASSRAVIARRPNVSMAVAAVIAEIGEAEACAELLANTGATIASVSLRRIAERHGDLARVREALLACPLLPPDCRHLLLVKIGDALKAAPFVVALIGRARAERVMREACAKACVTLIDATRMEEYPALVEHLRLSGELTPSFLVRTVAHGKIDFFGSVLAALAGQSSARVTPVLAGGRDVAVTALLRSAGLPAVMHRIILKALKVWREVANGKRIAGPQEVSWLMLEELGEPPTDAELAGLIKSIHLDTLRENARRHALALAAA